MAILTKTGNPVKGSDYTIQLNKADLIANSVVANDSYFNTFDVWKTIAVHYKSATGNQSINLIFDATLATPSFVLNLPTVTLGSFEVKSIIIYDFDNGYLQIPRSDLTTAEFDLTIDNP